LSSFDRIGAVKSVKKHKKYSTTNHNNKEHNMVMEIMNALHNRGGHILKSEFNFIYDIKV
jgi:site-specific DNA-adenine methylase